MFQMNKTNHPSFEIVKKGYKSLPTQYFMYAICLKIITLLL